MPSTTPFTFTFDPSVTAQQRQWWADALARTRFPIDRGGVAIQVLTVVEPSAEGHKDYMATIADAGGTRIEIRQGADDPNASFNQWLPNPAQDIKRFFQESVIHEVVGHAFWFNHFNDDPTKATIASWFTRTFGAGVGGSRGTLADWNPLDKPWGDRIQEALAEFSKDVYLDPEQRVFDNRTNWNFDEAHFGDYLTLVESYICQNIIAQ
jgi:hypothetical protein